MNARELAPAAAPAHAVTVYAGRRDWWHVPTSPLRHTGPARVALGIDAADVTGIGVWAMPDLTDLPPRAQLEALDALGGSALLCALKVDTSIRGWREHHAIELLDELLGDALWVAAVERPFGTKTRWVDGRRMRVGSEPTAAQRYWLGAVDALILPGGESTAISNLLEKEEERSNVGDLVKKGGIGGFLYLEVLDAERGLFQAELDAIDAQRQRLSATVELYKALGGGWQAAQP